MIFCENNKQTEHMQVTVWDTVMGPMAAARSPTYVSVFVVTVGSQEHLRYFVHSTEEKRQLSLMGPGKRDKGQEFFTNH